MSFGRVFRIKERASLQIRAEFNNIFNRTLLLGTTAGTYVNPSTALNTLPKAGPDGRYVSGFGTINTTGCAWRTARHPGGAHYVLIGDRRTSGEG